VTKRSVKRMSKETVSAKRAGGTKPSHVFIQTKPQRDVDAVRTMNQGSVGKRKAARESLRCAASLFSAG
jgi:hypothetical protein